MTWIEKKKNSQVMKICIGKREYEQLIPDDSNLALVQYWINLGREKYKIEERMESFYSHVEEVIINHASALKYEFENKMLVQNHDINDLKERINKLQNTLDQFIKAVTKKP